MNAILKTAIASALTLSAVVGPVATASAHHETVVVISAQACDNYATAYANGHVGPRGRKVIVGTLVGAGAGFLIGGFVFGAPGVGTLAGAGTGALVGAASGNAPWDNAYTYAYGACLQGVLLPY